MIVIGSSGYITKTVSAKTSTAVRLRDKVHRYIHGLTVHVSYTHLSDGRGTVR